jgi:hypothetical protein
MKGFFYYKIWCILETKLFIIGGIMKKTILTALIALAAFGAFAFDSEAFTPTGKISSYTKTDYTVTTKFGDYFRSPAAKYVHVYDASGLEIETSEYNAKDVLIDKIVYQYDTSRNLVSSIFYDSTNKLVWKTLMVYDATGKVKEESEFDKDNKLTGKTLYKYDGQKIDESYYNADGVLLSKTITTLNNKNKKGEVFAYLDDGTLDQHEVYTYNDNGSIAQIEVFDFDELLLEKVVYVYTNNNALSEEKMYDAKGVLGERKIYKYDAASGVNPSKITTYTVQQKFGGTVTEMESISEFAYKN